jgi:hypothetical protein
MNGKQIFGQKFFGQNLRTFKIKYLIVGGDIIIFGPFYQA